MNINLILLQTSFLGLNLFACYGLQKLSLVWQCDKWVCHIDYNTEGHPPHLDFYANKERIDIREYLTKFNGYIPKYRFAIKPDDDHNRADALKIT